MTNSRVKAMLTVRSMVSRNVRKKLVVPMRGLSMLSAKVETMMHNKMKFWNAIPTTEFSCTK